MFRDNGIRLAVLLLAGAAINTTTAHHSQAMFEMNKCLTLEGTVRAFEYSFPHSWLWIEVPGSDAPAVWGFEAAAPVQMIEIDKRWNRNIVKKGDKVTLQYSPNKSGSNSGALHSLVLPSGARVLAATAACALEPDAIGGAKPAPKG